MKGPWAPDIPQIPNAEGGVVFCPRKKTLTT